VRDPVDQEALDDLHLVVDRSTVSLGPFDCIPDALFLFRALQCLSGTLSLACLRLP
jgi:hypothetical protein